MSTISLFGVKWELNYDFWGATANIADCFNEDIGRFYISKSIGDCPQDYWFKMISLIHEKTVFGEPYFIACDKEIIFWKKELSSINRQKFSFCTLDECLNDFPVNFIDIQKRTLMLLYKKYPKYGCHINCPQYFECFAENDNDFIFIIKSMMKKNWIIAEIEELVGGKMIMQSIQIAEDGWTEIEKNIKESHEKQIFVAMWFDEKMDKAYNAIEKALRETDFVPRRIDKKQFNTEISGEILLEIANSGFILADVTGQRNGVYFEAGFAMGKRKPVILCCKKDDLENVHFDIRQYNHIVWDNENDLYIKLKDRISGTIILNNI